MADQHFTGNGKPTGNGRNGDFRFADVEVDVTAQELRKGGVKVRPGKQGFLVLQALLERPGEVVTLKELEQRLWPDGTHVDYPNAINQAVSRIRRVLNDSATHPRFIETLPTIGYRFIGRLDTETVSTPDHSEKRKQWPWYAGVGFAGAVAGALLVILAVPGLVETDSSLPLRNFRVSLAPIESHDVWFGVTPSVSPNGRYIAYATKEGLWVHDLRTGRRRLLPATEGAEFPFWSPRSDVVAFAVGQELKRIPVTGGQAVRLCMLPYAWMRGGSWSPDGKSIVFASNHPLALYEIPSGGGEPHELFSAEQIETMREEAGRTLGLPGPVGARAEAPYFVRSNRSSRVLLFEFGWGARQTMMAVDLKTGRFNALGRGTQPSYGPSGYLLYQAGYDLWAAPFSPETLKTSGDPFVLAQDATSPTVTDRGTLVYLDRLSERRQAVRVNRKGKPLEVLTEPHLDTVGMPRMSPDGKYIAIDVRGERGPEVPADPPADTLIYDLTRTIAKNLVTRIRNAYYPVWSPTSDSIMFSSNRGGEYDIYLRSVGSNNEEPQLILGEEDRESITDWSSDGRYILYRRDVPGSGRDLWYAELAEDGRTWKPRPFLQSPAIETFASFSPDASFVVYQSKESGEAVGEVYIRSFPNGDVVQQISANGGGLPVWGPKGDEVVYLEGQSLITVPVSTYPKLMVGEPERLFDVPLYRCAEVAPDGRSFIVVEAAGEQPEHFIHVVQNWTADLQN